MYSFKSVFVFFFFFFVYTKARDIVVVVVLDIHVVAAVDQTTDYCLIMNLFIYTHL